MADKLIKANFISLSPNKFKYQSLKTDNEFIVKINCLKSHNKCSCSCKTFIKKGICLHVVSLSNLYELNYFHPKYSFKEKEKPEYFISKLYEVPNPELGNWVFFDTITITITITA